MSCAAAATARSAARVNRATTAWSSSRASEGWRKRGWRSASCALTRPTPSSYRFVVWSTAGGSGFLKPLIDVTRWTKTKIVTQKQELMCALWRALPHEHEQRAVHQKSPLLSVFSFLFSLFILGSYCWRPPCQVLGGTGTKTDMAVMPSLAGRPPGRLHFGW